jgi:hypothetical protein
LVVSFTAIRWAKLATDDDPVIRIVGVEMFALVEELIDMIKDLTTLIP